MKFLLNIQLLLLLTFVASAQYNFVKNITIDDGLNSNEAINIMQDSRGFIWVASSTSVQRYDGYEFVTYYENSTDLYCQNETPQILFEDSDSSIWLGTNKGIYNFTYESGVFEKIFLQKDKKSDFNIIGIEKGYDSETIVAITENAGIFTISSKSKNTINAYSSYKGEIVSCYYDKKGKLYIATFPHNFYKIDLKKKNITLLNDTLRINTIHPFFDESVLIQSKINQNYFFDDSLGYKRDKHKIPAIDLSAKLDRNTLVGCKNFNFHLIEKKGENAIKTSELLNISSKINSQPNSLFVDNEKNLWVCTDTRGIFLFSYSQKWFEKIDSYYLNDSKKTVSNSNEAIVVLATDSLAFVFRDSLLETPYRTFTFKEKIDPYCIEIESDSIFFIGTYNGLLKIALSPNTITEFPFESKIVALSIFNDFLWIGTSNNGLYKMQLSNGRIEKVREIIIDTLNVEIPEIITTISHTGKELWIGSCEGIIVMNPETNAGIIYSHNTLNAQCLNSNIVNSIYVDKEGDVWVGSNNGINLFQAEDSSFINVAPEGNAQRLYIEHITEFKSTLFLSTNRGLVALNKETHEFYTTSTNIIFDKFAYSKPCKLPDSSFVLLNKKSLLKINPELYPAHKKHIPLYVTSLTVFNQSIDKIDGDILTDNILSASSIRLSLADNFFTLIFSGLKYSSSKNIEYAYMLEGFDNEWKYTNSKNRYASYANLSPGEYTFKLKAGISGNFNEKDYTISISINPPFWSTTVFKGIVLVVLLASIYIILILREKRISKLNEKLNEQVKSQTIVLKKQNEELLDLNNTKDKFMTIIAHDLKNPLNSLIGFTELLHEKHAEYENEQRQKFIDIINNASKQMYELLTNLFDWSRTQTGKIQFQPQEFNVLSAINGTKDLLSHVADKKNISIKSNAFPITVFADKNMTTTTVRNLVSNSIKFTPKGGSIEINCMQEENHIVISVSDTGVGMDSRQMGNLFKIDKANSTLGTEQEHGTGLGLILCKEFVKMNKGTISVESEKGKGTTISFTVPLP